MDIFRLFTPCEEHGRRSSQPGTLRRMKNWLHDRFIRDHRHERRIADAEQRLKEANVHLTSEFMPVWYELQGLIESRSKQQVARMERRTRERRRSVTNRQIAI